MQCLAYLERLAGDPTSMIAYVAVACLQAICYAPEYYSEFVHVEKRPIQYVVCFHKETLVVRLWYEHSRR